MIQQRYLTKWQLKIHNPVTKKQFYIGTFNTPEEAAMKEGEIDMKIWKLKEKLKCDIEEILKYEAKAFSKK